MNDLVAGRRAVLEALRAGTRRIARLFVLDGGRGGPFREVMELATKQGIPVESASRERLDRLARGVMHQGVVAVGPEPSAPGTGGLEGLLARLGAGGEPALLVALDEVKDPQNVGAVVRTAEAAGAQAVILTAHRTAGDGPGLARASAGAVEYLPLIRVVNLRDALERLKEAGCRVVGADAAGTRAHTDTDLAGPVVLVLGEEGRGLRELTRKTCDELVRIPMRGKVASLNVSAAAAVLLYEAVRQRLK